MKGQKVKFAFIIIAAVIMGTIALGCESQLKGEEGDDGPAGPAGPAGYPCTSSPCIDGADINPGTISSDQLAGDTGPTCYAIKAANICNEAITTDEIKNNTIKNEDMGVNSVGPLQITNRAVEYGKIAENAVGSYEISDGAVDTADLASGAVTPPKLDRNYAGSTSVAGPALDLTCALACVDSSEVSFNWALGTAKGGMAVNADQLDGMDSSEFAPVNHTHSGGSGIPDIYVFNSGDTVSGDLDVNGILRVTTSASADLTGLNVSASSSGNNNEVVAMNAVATSSGNNAPAYGGKFTATAAGNTEVFAGHFTATAGSTGNKYGIWASAPAGANSYAGRFQGNLVHIGSAGTRNYADSDGDLYVQNDLEVDGNLYVSGTFAHNHDAGDIVSGTLNNARFSAYSDLGAENYLNNDTDNDLLTRAQLDGRYAFIAHNHTGGHGSLLDADMLDGQHASAFAPAAHNHSGADITSGTVAAAYIDSTMATDAELASGLAGKANTSHTHSGADITSGTIGNAYFSAYSDLSAEGYLDNNNGNDVLLRSQADGLYSLDGHTHTSADLPANDMIDGFTALGGATVTTSPSGTYKEDDIAIVTVPQAATKTGLYQVHFTGNFQVTASATAATIPERVEYEIGLYLDRDGAPYTNAVLVRSLKRQFYLNVNDETRIEVFPLDLVRTDVAAAGNDYVFIVRLKVRPGSKDVTYLKNSGLLSVVMFNRVIP
jgi:hypothetical protein